MSNALTSFAEIHSAVSLAQQIGDGLGTFAFAVSGALLAVRKNFDIIGIGTLAAVTAVGGGITRDLIVGRHPPVAFTDLWYLGIALAAAATIFFWHPPRKLTGRPLDIADALGLGTFCVTGTLTAFQFGFGAPSAALIGVVTAVGGGALRDLLAGQVPRVLRPDQEIYAIPALLGAAVTAALVYFDRLTDLTGTLAALGTVALRLLALRYHWRAPQARAGKRSQ
ncbi:trimeric intracellular cation channel family protein [Nocardia gipuzkoensis]|uniref:trimeric intracellular cation channel family protein n=1 Tax=Nocardia gipuzkoensis TaxID=2749991 RepID=UPI003EE20588